MLTNAEIVIFNQFPDREKKRMIYVPHKVPKVWLYKDQKVTVGEHGLKSAEIGRASCRERVCLYV